MSAVKRTKQKERFIIPEFETREEEAAFWDNTDLSKFMEEAEEVSLEWTEREDRCDRCGAVMETHQIDLHLAGGLVTLHNVKWYVCRTPRCGQTKLPPQVEKLAQEIEESVRQAGLWPKEKKQTAPLTQEASQQEA
ncbi:MAG: hypothetical protein ACUVV0_13270 [Anaerolineae bacterium]